MSIPQVTIHSPAQTGAREQASRLWGHIRPQSKPRWDDRRRRERGPTQVCGRLHESRIRSQLPRASPKGTVLSPPCLFRCERPFVVHARFEFFLEKLKSNPRCNCARLCATVRLNFMRVRFIDHANAASFHFFFFIVPQIEELKTQLIRISELIPEGLEVHARLMADSVKDLHEHLVSE